MTRTCPRCDRAQSGDMFIASRPNCRPCRTETAEQWRRTPSGAESVKRSNAKAYSTERRHLDSLRAYGLTAADYASLLNQQDGVCAICHQACKSGRRLAVDHDHACCSGRTSCGACVRGLLCARCNAGIAQFCDDPALLNAAICYIGNGQVIQSPKPGDAVKISTIWDSGHAWGVAMNL